SLRRQPSRSTLFPYPTLFRSVARQWGGVAISFAGVFLIATQGHPERLSFNRGDLMAIASMMLWAGYTVLLRLRRDPLRVIELLRSEEDTSELQSPYDFVCRVL